MKRFVYIILASFLFFTEIFSACAVAVYADTVRLTRAQVFAAILAAQEQYAQLIYEQRCMQLKFVDYYEAMEGFQVAQKSVADILCIHAAHSIAVEDVRKQLCHRMRSAFVHEEMCEEAEGEGIEDDDYTSGIAILEYQDEHVESSEHLDYVENLAVGYKRKIMLRRRAGDLVAQLWSHMLLFAGMHFYQEGRNGRDFVADLSKK